MIYVATALQIRFTFVQAQLIFLESVDRLLWSCDICRVNDAA
jgi:hypothetical protein